MNIEVKEKVPARLFQVDVKPIIREEAPNEESMYRMALFDAQAIDFEYDQAL